MKQVISKEAIQQLFTEARTHHFWLSQPVSDELLHSIYDLAKWGPTSVNSGPMRVVFIKSSDERKKLLPALTGSNISQVEAAPVTAIIAQDERFWDHLPKLFPTFDVKSLFDSNPALSTATAFRNSSLQGAYLIFAARALGLDVCPMSGFDNSKVDQTFFKDTSWKSNFICTMGYGDQEKLYPRGPRLDFEEACKIV